MDKKYGVWWTNPSLLIIFLLIPILFMQQFLSPQLLPSKVIDFRNFSTLILALAFYLVILLGVQIGKSIPTHNDEVNEYALNIKVALRLTSFSAFIGHIAWFYPFLLNPSIAIGQSRSGISIRTLVTPLPGIKGLTEFGCVYAAIWSCSKWNWKIPNSKIDKNILYLLGGFAFLRSVVWNERLAFLEFTFPILFFFTIGILRHSKNSKTVPRILNFIPILLPLLFGVAEYFRSWQYYRQFRADYVRFIVERLATYYVTSQNNGSGFYQKVGTDFQYFYPWSWISQFPFFREKIYNFFQFNDPYLPYLRQFGNLEFNTATGIFPVLVGFSLLGGMLFALIIGVWAGKSYLSCYRGVQTRSVIVLPFLLLAIADLGRICYFFEVRFFAVLIGIYILIPRKKMKKLLMLRT